MPKWPTVQVVMMIKKCILPALFCWALLPLNAQNIPSDVQLWSSAEITGSPAKKLDLSGSFQSRLDQNVSRLRGNYFSIEASRKIASGLRILVNARFATSNRWDRYRFGVGIQRNIKWGASGKSEIKLKFQYQYQFEPGFDIRYGINTPQQNLRFKTTWDRKIIKKTILSLSVEPLWRIEASETFFRRVRYTAIVKRSLPGPWTLEAGYTYQQVYNNPGRAHIARIGLSYELKRKKSDKQGSPTE